jgi:hypothetical protein
LKNWTGFLIKLSVTLTLTLIFAVTAQAGNTLPEIAKRCRPNSGSEQFLYSSDFKWGYGLREMIEKFATIYRSPKRLPQRAFWDTNQKTLKLPFSGDRGGDIPITTDFVQTVTRHIERAFELGYVDGVFFPDMGHSHLLIPDQLMKEKYDAYPVDQMSALYRDLFQDPSIEILYHTAEQLTTLDSDGQVLQDPKVRWRHQTRNIVGRNHPKTDLQVLQNPESKANTVGSVPGYYWWGAGFNLSANKNGCFEYRAKGKVYYYDLIMYDLTMDPSAPPIFD